MKNIFANDYICYRFKDIDKLSSNFNLWISIIFLYQNMMEYTKIHFLNFLCISFEVLKMTKKCKLFYYYYYYYY
jgi:hypothetical protein